MKLTIDIDEEDVRRYAGYRPESWVEGSALRLVIDAARKVFPQYVEGEWYKVTLGTDGRRTSVLFRTNDGWAYREGGGTVFLDAGLVPTAVVHMVEAQ